MYHGIPRDYGASQRTFYKVMQTLVSNTKVPVDTLRSYANPCSHPPPPPPQKKKKKTTKNNSYMKPNRIMCCLENHNYKNSTIHKSQSLVPSGTNIPPPPPSPPAKKKTVSNSACIIAMCNYSMYVSTYQAIRTVLGTVLGFFT